jgi:Skp family chaperone for outer membrane proteins
MPTLFCRFLAVPFITTLLLSSVAFAEFRVATVDVNRILNESEESVSKKKELDKLSLAAKKKVEDKKERLTKIEEKIKSGKIKTDSKEAEQFRVDAREFARFVKDTQEELKRNFLKSNKALTEKILNQIKSYAKKNKIDLVLDKSSGGRSAVLFGAPTADITDDIIDEVNS